MPADKSVNQAVVRTLIVVLLVGSLASSGFTFRKKKEKSEAQPAVEQKAPEPAVPVSDLEKELAELKTAYAQLETDRDNVLQQTRILLTQKSETVDVKDQNQKLKNKVDRYSRHEQLMRRRVNALIGRTRSGQAANEELQAKYGDLSRRYVAIDQENEALSRALGAKMEQDPEFQKLLSQTQNVRQENDTLRSDLKKTQTDRDKAQKVVSIMQEHEKKALAETLTLKEKIAALEKDKKELIDHAQKLLKEVERAPQRFGEMAQQNKLLIRETSDMHYNLGVFFSESRNYDRAVKEFERALDFNPNNAKVHYNLGYLYAEQLKRHDEAMNHFQRYLDLDPNTKESEDVRRYLLVRTSYGDKPLLEEKGKPDK